MDKEEKTKEVLSSVQDAKDKALALKQDDSIQSTDARRWAIVFTDLEKIEAYIQAYLVGD